jgi:hypothetical protein
MKNKKQSLNKIPFNKIENLRKSLDYKVFEMAQLLGFTTRQYNRCKNEGEVLAYRYFALKNALMIHALQESQERLKMISEL